MDTSEKNTVAAAVTQKEQEPSNKNQHLRHRGRSNSPPLKRVLVCDCERKTVQVRLWFPLESYTYGAKEPYSIRFKKLPDS